MRAVLLKEEVFKPKNLDRDEAEIYKAVKDLQSIGENASLQNYKSSNMLGDRFNITLKRPSNTPVDLNFYTKQYYETWKKHEPSDKFLHYGWQIILHPYSTDKQLVMNAAPGEWDRVFRRLVKLLHNKNHTAEMIENIENRIEEFKLDVIKYKRIQKLLNEE